MTHIVGRLARGRAERWLAGASAVACLAGLLLAGCGSGNGDGGGGDAAGVEQTLRASADAWTAGEIATYLASVTDRFLATEFQTTPQEAPTVLEAVIGEPPRAVLRVSEIEALGEAATAIVELSEAKELARQRASLLLQAGVWKIDAVEELPVERPDGVPVVDVTLREFAFDFDHQAVAGGSFGFHLTNTGVEQHELQMIRLPVEVSLDFDDPNAEGITAVAQVAPLDPGAEADVVFAEQLGPGRYIMICTLPSPDGTPHHAKGMQAEFILE